MAPDDSISHSLAKALSLEPDSVKLDAHGGSSFSSTFKLTGTKNGKTVKYFLKLGRGEEAKIMFRGSSSPYPLRCMTCADKISGEHASLNAIHAAVPFFSPASHAHGELSPSQFFLATDFIDMSPSSRVQPGTGLSFAAKLAKLHTTPAPIPEGYSEPMFGFLHPTCCGATVQENDWEATWPVFFAKHRIGTMRARAEKRGMRPEKSKVLEQLEKKVVPRLLGAVKDVQPVVVHGDLWSGNHSRAAVKKDGRDGDEDMVMEEMVFDPSCVYGHSEYELGIMHMFGGFGSSFWKEYESLVPKAEPVDEWADRIELYEM